MLKKIAYSGLLLSFFLSGCATMQQKHEHSIPQADATPSISKSLAAQENKINEPTGIKRKVAIGRFSNETRYGQSFFLDKNNDRIGKQAMDILSAKLFQTGKFIMLERADLSKIDKELKIGKHKKLDNAADYIILGSITEFGRKEVSDVGLFSRVKKQEAFARVHIRIIDVSTGEIIYSDEGKGTAFSEAGNVMGVGDRAAYDSELNDKAINAAISDVTSNIVEHMLDKPWKGYILDYQDDNFIISGGKSQNIKIGDTFTVYKKGKTVKNPQTNMIITLPGKKIASVKVMTLLGNTPENKISLVRKTDGDLSQYKKAKDYSGLYIEVGK